MPRLSIDIEARFAKFQDALDQISRNTSKSVKTMNSSFGVLKSTLGGLGAALSVGAFAHLIKSSIDSADNMNDLSKKTGVAVETLGGLGYAASQSGSSLEGIGKAFGKMNLQIAEARTGSEKALEPFKAMGITLKDLQTLKSDEIFLRIADAFKSYEDGPEKAALGNAVFKKSYMDIIPTLDEGGDKLRSLIGYYEKYSGVTTDVAQKADAFNDEMSKLKLLTASFFQTLAADLLPAMRELVNLFVETGEKGSGLGTVLKGLANIATFFSGGAFLSGDDLKNVDQALERTTARLAELGKTRDVLAKQSGFAKFFFDDDIAIVNKQIDVAEKEIAILRGRKSAENAGVVYGGDTVADKPFVLAKKGAPSLPNAGGVSAVDSTSKKILEGKLKDLERFSQSEVSILNHKSELLDVSYQHNIVSLSEYAARRKEMLEKTVSVQSDVIEKEIALINASRKKGDADGNADVDNKIEALRDRQVKLQADAAHEAQKQFGENADSAREYKESLQEINVTLLEQQGRFADAAAQRFDTSNKDLRQKITVTRDTAIEQGDTDTAATSDRALQQLAASESLIISQAKLNELNVEATKIRDKQTAVEERSLMAVISGSETEEQSILRVVAARRESLSSLTDAVDKYEEFAAGIENNDAALEAVEKLRLEIELLKNATDELSTSRDFMTGFNKAFDDYVRQATNAALQGQMAFDIASQTMGDGIYDALQGNFDNIGTSFKQMVDRMVADWLAAQALIVLKEVGANLLKSFAGAAAGAAAADGLVFQGGNVVPFAMGGIVSQPTLFRMARGRVGLMGEAGPEAVVPLKRGKDGTLGIAMSGAGVAETIVPLRRGADGKLGIAALTTIKETSVSKTLSQVFQRENVIPFAMGGIIDSPTVFQMANGATGLIGKDGADGKPGIAWQALTRLKEIIASKALSESAAAVVAAIVTKPTLFQMARGEDGKPGGMTAGVLPIVVLHTFASVTDKQTLSKATQTITRIMRSTASLMSGAARLAVAPWRRSANDSKMSIASPSPQPIIIQHRLASVTDKQISRAVQTLHKLKDISANKALSEVAATAAAGASFRLGNMNSVRADGIVEKSPSSVANGGLARIGEAGQRGRDGKIAISDTVVSKQMVAAATAMRTTEQAVQALTKVKEISATKVVSADEKTVDRTMQVLTTLKAISAEVVKHGIASAAGAGGTGGAAALASGAVVQDGNIIRGRDGKHGMTMPAIDAVKTIVPLRGAADGKLGIDSRTLTTLKEISAINTLSNSAITTAAAGAVFERGNVIRFAAGGIVHKPTVFAMARGATGLMGESGPEAVVPLKRGKDGKLGIASVGGGGSTIVINQSFAPGTDKRTIDQAAQAVGQVSQRAMRRNG